MPTAPLSGVVAVRVQHIHCGGVSPSQNMTVQMQLTGADSGSKSSWCRLEWGGEEAALTGAPLAILPFQEHLWTLYLVVEVLQSVGGQEVVVGSCRVDLTAQLCVCVTLLGGVGPHVTKRLSWGDKSDSMITIDVQCTCGEGLGEGLASPRVSPAFPAVTATPLLQAATATGKSVSSVPAPSSAPPLPAFAPVSATASAPLPSIATASSAVPDPANADATATANAPVSDAVVPSGEAAVSVRRRARNGTVTSHSFGPGRFIPALTHVQTLNHDGLPAPALLQMARLFPQCINTGPDRLPLPWRRHHGVVTLFVLEVVGWGARAVFVKATLMSPSRRVVSTSRSLSRPPCGDDPAWPAVSVCVCVVDLWVVCTLLLSLSLRPVCAYVCVLVYRTRVSLTVYVCALGQEDPGLDVVYEGSVGEPFILVAECWSENNALLASGETELSFDVLCLVCAACARVRVFIHVCVVVFVVCACA